MIIVFFAGKCSWWATWLRIWCRMRRTGGPNTRLWRRTIKSRENRERRHLRAMRLAWISSSWHRNTKLALEAISKTAYLMVCCHLHVFPIAQNCTFSSSVSVLDAADSNRKRKSRNCCVVCRFLGTCRAVRHGDDVCERLPACRHIRRPRTRSICPFHHAVKKT